MRVKCGSCGKLYDYDKDELCPKCGAFNQPDRGKRGTAPPAGVRPGPNPRRGEARPQGLGRLWVAAVVVVLAAWLAFVGFGAYRTYIRTSAEPATRSEGTATRARTPEERAEEPASREEPAVHGEEPAASAFQPESEAFQPEDEALPAGSEADFSGAESLPAAPAEDVTALASFVYGIPFGDANGVHLDINATGPADDPAVQKLLISGERAIFIDFTATVSDPELFGKVFFQEPYVTVGQDHARTLYVAGADLGSPFSPLDVDGMRYTDRTVTRGQLFFALPEDCYTFMLRYGDPDRSFYIQTLNV